MQNTKYTLNIPLFKTHWEESDIEAVKRVITRGTFWADGPEIREFERRIADFVGRKYAVSFNSGTSALQIALLSHGIKGCEVIVPSFTFIATSNPVVLAGGTPVFAESEEETFGLDADDVAKKITSKTKAIILIHYAGCASRDTLKLRELADKHGILLIEDAAESLGASIDGRKVGTFGDSAMFSFCQNKVITMGEGGIIVTNDTPLYEKMKLLRSHGRFEKTDGDYFSSTGDNDYIMLGYNLRLPTMSAALGISQLNNINQVITMRQEHAEFLHQHLSTIPPLKIPKAPEGFNHIYQMYTILLDNKTIRDTLQKCLQENGIMSKVYFNPVHMKTYYIQHFGCKQGDLPFTEALSERVLTLPFYPDLTKQELKHIIFNIKQFFEQNTTEKYNNI